MVSRWLNDSDLLGALRGLKPRRGGLVVGSPDGVRASGFVDADFEIIGVEFRAAYAGCSNRFCHGCVRPVDIYLALGVSW